MILERSQNHIPPWLLEVADLVNGAFRDDPPYAGSDGISAEPAAGQDQGAAGPFWWTWVWEAWDGEI